MSRRSLKGWLFAASSSVALIAGAASAQTTIPPERYTLDERGVDLVTGQWMPVSGGVSIGPADTGLSHAQILLENNAWWDLSIGGVKSCDPDCFGGITVIVDGVTELFSTGILTPGITTFPPKEATGSTLVYSHATHQYTYTRGDGTIYEMESRGTEFYLGTLARRTSPTGLVTTYNYRREMAMVCIDPPEPDPELGYPPGGGGDGSPVCRNRTFDRLQSYQTNTGYQIHYDYVENVDAASANWRAVSKVTALNLAVDYCDPVAPTCTLTRNWPSVSISTSTPSAGVTDRTLTDQTGFATRYRSTGTIGYGGSTQVFLGAALDPVVTISQDYDEPLLVTDSSGVWSYTITDAGPVRTMAVSGPMDQHLTVVTDLTVGRPSSATRVTSVSPAASQTWSWTYTTGGRVATETGPEGISTAYAYDTRGNVTQVTQSPKTGAAEVALISSAAYPATCANPVTCNLPTSTTDVLGNVTDYTWDSTHGGLLSVTSPAPATGAARPQTRITYAPQTARYKNSAGVITAAPSAVILPVEVSACATGASCDATSAEVLTTVAYGVPGLASNLQPSSVSRGSGVNPNMAVTSMTYTPEGDTASVNGPLPGADDTTVYRYDGRRRMVGVIGPDPDAAGPHQNRAQRLTYNDWNQVTLSETGTAPGYTDAAFASFSPMVKTATVYDERGRPLLASQHDGSGATVGVQQVSYDAAGRPDCTAVRMNPALWGSLPTSACTPTTPGSFGADRIVRTTYDAAGRPRSATSAYGQPEAATSSVTYGANGQVASLTDGAGNVSIQHYDGFNRPVTLRYPNASGGGTSMTDYAQLTYDAFGRVVASRSRGGLITTSAYDKLGRVTFVNAPVGTMDVGYTYDNLGRVLTSTGNGQTLTRVWDPLSRLTSETGPLGTMAYQYDAAGRQTRITWPDATFAQYDRNVYGDVSAIRYNNIGFLAQYSYNAMGQTTTIQRITGAATSYAYDPVGRLITLSHDMPGGAGADVSFGFTWNPAGQIASRSVSNAAYVYAPTTGATSYGVNGRNQTTTVNGAPVTYDASQNTATALGASYGYDAANRLTSATIAGNPYSFSYDPAGRLFSGVGGRFQYVGDQLVSEYDASGVEIVRHIPGPGLDQTIVSGIGTVFSQQIADERGSVIGMVDQSGTVTANRYDEYGVSDASNRFQYAGQAWMAPGIYNYRARAYAPELGRFLQADPIGYQAGPNLYGYVGGDPVNLTDPLGLNGKHINEGRCATRNGRVVTNSRRLGGKEDHDFCVPTGVVGGSWGFGTGIGNNGGGGGGFPGEAQQMKNCSSETFRQWTENSDWQAQARIAMAKALSTPSYDAPAIRGSEYGFFSGNMFGTYETIGSTFTNRLSTSVTPGMWIGRWDFASDVLYFHTHQFDQSQSSGYRTNSLSRADMRFARRSRIAIMAERETGERYCYEP